jgi:hypothetical protein
MNFTIADSVKRLVNFKKTGMAAEDCQAGD